MMKVDRLGWAAGLAFSWHGQLIGLRVSDAQMLPRLESSVPPSAEPIEDGKVNTIYSLWTAGESRKGVRGFHMCFCDHQVLERSLELEPVIRTLRSSLESHLAIAAKRRVFVRAGVVGWRGGALIIMGGETSGTSTLVSSLVDQGADFFSDRFAVLDTKGRVHPYPVPPMCRKEEVEETNTRIADGKASSWRVPKGPLPATGIILTEYRPGANWRPKRMTPAQSVMAMLQRTPAAHSRPDTALTALSNAAERAVTLKSKRGEAEIAASDILRRFS